MTRTTLIIATLLATACGSKMSSSGGDDPEETGTAPIDTGTDTPPPDETGTPPPVVVDISEDHPRLFFSPPDVPRLQGQIYDYERVEVVGRWDDFVSARRDPSTTPLPEGSTPPTTDAGWSALTAPLPNMAMYALLTSDEEVHTQTLEWMRRVAALETWGSGEDPTISKGAATTLQAFVTAFDMLHDSLEPAERNAHRGKIVSAANALHTALTTPATPAWTKQWSGADAQVAHAALLMVGLTLEHEHDKAPRWIETVERFVDSTLTGLEDIGDGSWPEGPSLGSEATSSLSQSLFLLHRHTGLDADGNPWLAARSEAMLRRALPGQLGLLTAGDGTAAWTHGPVHQACFIDSFTDTHSARWMSNQHIAASDGSIRGPTLWLEFLWCDTGTTTTAPAPTDPRTHHFDQGGTITWHSGFAAGDSSLVIRAGKPIGENIWTAISEGSADARGLDLRHLHPDAGSFGWYPGGTPILVTGRNQSPKRTQLENTYTFGTATSISRGWSATDREHWWPSGSFHADVGDLTQIGQLGEWDLDFGPPSTLNEADVRFEFNQTKRGVTLVGASIEGMYPTSYTTDAGWQELGLQRFARYWVVLEEGIVLIFDHLRHSTDLTHYNRYNAASGGFSVSGTAATVYGSDGSSWVVDAISGGSVYTDQLIQDVSDPASPWADQLVVSNSAAIGAHHHLTVLRSTSQAAVLTGWSPADQGVVADLAITSEGVSSIISVRFASSADATARQAFLGFSGTMGITRGAESEIRF